MADVASVVAPVLFSGALLLAIGFPRPGVARTILRRWAPRLEPTPQRVAMVRRHLVRRRAPFAVLLLLVWWGSVLFVSLVGPLAESSAWHSVATWHERASWTLLLPCMIIAALAAEVVTSLDRPTGAVRAAPLRVRHAADLAPRYGFVMLCGMAVGALALAAWGLVRLRDLSDPAPADPEVLPARMDDALDARPLAWFAVIAVVVTVAMVAGIVRLATTRPVVHDERHDDELDTALRARSARLAVGLGIATVGMLASAATEALRVAANLLDGAYTGSFWGDFGGLVGGVLASAGIVGWILVANPPWPGFRAALAGASSRSRA